MNLIETLKDYIRLKHPDARIVLTPPLRPDGIWSLDVDLANSSLAIEWSQSNGFGLSSTSNENFGEGPDEVLATIELAQHRVDQLLANKERTAPPSADYSPGCVRVEG